MCFAPAHTLVWFAQTASTRLGSAASMPFAQSLSTPSQTSVAGVVGTQALAQPLVSAGDDEFRGADVPGAVKSPALLSMSYPLPFPAKKPVA